MNGTTTRARTGRAAADTRHATRSRRRYDDVYAGSYVDGANALQIGYADPEVAEPIPAQRRPVAPEPVAEPVPDAPPSPVALPRASFIVLVLGVVVAGVLGILVLNTKINENAFRLKDLHDRQSTLDLQEQQLSDDLALAASPNSLAAAARRLGLVPAGTPAFIRLPDGRVLGVPQPAAGPQSLSGPQAAQAGK
jgi:hypothetical protein